MGWYEKYRTKECVEGLQKAIDILDEKDRIINSLREENKRLEDEHYKDEELKKLREKIDRLEGDCARGFPITEKEQEKIDKIRVEHKKTCPLCKFDYVFECYEIVNFGSLKCRICGEEIKFAEW
mgnify:CR=1 FL=1